ncbi:senecionine N-oxygenase [Phlebotomus argentipes]|uniref:senecionine N-oxygenase n=1 Tax=Phlebotomus argentipes TaxID=94469 RepID=UPI002892C8AF|nr:senecionine N-oxygenase [Phlebotomus argentipes]
MGAKKRVAVIGAGTAGLCAAKHSIAAGMDVTVFEQMSQPGGTWVYSDDVGTDKFGLQVHTSMYRGLRTNLPKEIMGYPDFPIPGDGVSYIPAAEMLAFLQSYAKSFNVTSLIKFNHHVIRVRPLGQATEPHTWEVMVKDMPNDELLTQTFDFIFVCNGHYHTPYLPRYPGQDDFRGRLTHSHDYRCPEPYKGQTVLVIGAGPSGMDIAYDISKWAERVTLSHHLPEPPKTKFPPNVVQRPDPIKFTTDGMLFQDGVTETFDVVLFCTGYRYTFPFLSVDCGISVDQNFVQPLYKHCININYPTMGFAGLPFYVCACQMIDLQVRFCVKLWSGGMAMPSRQEMLEDTQREMEERFQKRGYKKRHAHMMGPDQGKYYADLAECAGLVPLKPVITKLHNESSQKFLDDLTNFRNDVYEIVDDETFIQVK